MAGTFYPGDPLVLRDAVEAALQRATSSPSAPPPKAVVVPHAGYMYSGPVAASAYARVLPLRGAIEQVAVLGPAHRTPLPTAAVSSADAFETPLGLARVDTEFAGVLVADGVAVVSNEAHASEHSIEVQLPFLQVTLGDVLVLPIAVGQMPEREAAALFDLVWGGSQTLIVVSTDLSHYHDDATARNLDQRTASAIVAKDTEAIGPEDACGAYALRGLLAAARDRNLDVELLDLRTSADTAGEPSRVVGYGAFAVG